MLTPVSVSMLTPVLCPLPPVSTGTLCPLPHLYLVSTLTSVLCPLAHTCTVRAHSHMCCIHSLTAVSRVHWFTPVPSSLMHLCPMSCVCSHTCVMCPLTHLCPLAHTSPFFTCAPVLRVLCLLAHLCDVATRSHLSRVLHSHTCVPCPLTHLSWSGTPGSQSPLHSSGWRQRPEEWSFVARIILSKAGTWWCGLHCPSSCPPSPACLGLGASVAAPGPPAGAPPTLG